MKRTFFIGLFIAVALLGASRVNAQSDGNPVGNLESLNCSTASGWAVDITYVPPVPGHNGTPPGTTPGDTPGTNPGGSVVYGCTDSRATNYDVTANVDNGTCKYPSTDPTGSMCVSRYRWVNVGAGTMSQAQACAYAGATAVASSPNGICASGEDRPTGGALWGSIYYSRGMWGGGNGGGGTFDRKGQDGYYRCYQPEQKKDEDNTDVAVAYYCDFGSQYQDYCPADNTPPTYYGGSGGTEGCFAGETSIDMADGTIKKVSALAAGDIVKGETGSNRVIEVKHVILGDRPLYSLNGRGAFVTAGHPFKTTDGWKSIDPKETAKEGVDLTVTTLSVGDKIMTETGTETVESIVPHAADARMALYNPVLDGDHTYYASGLLVHNKVNNSSAKLQVGSAASTLFDTIASFFRPIVARAASSDSVDVLIYDDTNLIAQITASQSRPDVNQFFGISGNHGFTWTIPESLKDNAAHNLHFIAKNKDDIGKDNEISGSPRSLTCAPTTNVDKNTPPSDPVLTCPSDGSTVDTSLQVSFVSNDNGKVQYLVDWDNNGTTDEIVPGATSFVDSGSKQSASRSWSTSGTKTVKVTAKDDKGLTSAAASCSFKLSSKPICSDGIDNDGDGKIDYPADPGCANASDNDETDTVSVNAPVITFTADPSTIPSPQTVNLAWSATNASSCSASGGWTGDVGVSGNRNVAVSETTKYGLTCTGMGGSSDKSVTVTLDTNNTNNNNNDGGNGGGGNGGNGSNNGTNASGFSLSGDTLIPIQVLGHLSGVSKTAVLSINPVNGYSAPITLGIQSIQPENGQSLDGITMEYSWQAGQDKVFSANPTDTFTTSGGSEYRNASGYVVPQLTVRATGDLPKGKYAITVVGTSGAQSATHVIELDSSPLAPSFREF